MSVFMLQLANDGPRLCRSVDLYCSLLSRCGLRYSSLSCLHSTATCDRASIVVNSIVAGPVFQRLSPFRSHNRRRVVGLRRFLRTVFYVTTLAKT